MSRKRVVVSATTPDEADDAVAAMSIATRAIRDLYGDKFDADGHLLTSDSSDAAKLRWIADWLEDIDRRVCEYTETPPGDGMQRTLRHVADILDRLP